MQNKTLELRPKPRTCRRGLGAVGIKTATHPEPKLIFPRSVKGSLRSQSSPVRCSPVGLRSAAASGCALDPIQTINFQSQLLDNFPKYVPILLDFDQQKWGRCNQLRWWSHVTHWFLTAITNLNIFWSTYAMDYDISINERENIIKSATWPTSHHLTWSKTRISPSWSVNTLMNSRTHWYSRVEIFRHSDR